jgi:hypothetical protein
VGDGKSVESAEALFVDDVGVPSHALGDKQVGLPRKRYITIRQDKGQGKIQSWFSISYTSGR